MGRNILQRIIRNYTPESMRNQGRGLEKLLDMRDRKGSKSGPILW